jgi:hypothetical protein
MIKNRQPDSEKRRRHCGAVEYKIQNSVKGGHAMSAAFLPVAGRSGAFSPACWFSGFASYIDFLDRITEFKKFKGSDLFWRCPFG